MQPVNMEAEWKVHSPNLLGEILNNQGAAILHKPLIIFARLLDAVGRRASQLNDPELNALMCRLTIYSIADPESEDYDPALVQEILDARHT